MGMLRAAVPETAVHKDRDALAQTYADCYTLVVADIFSKRKRSQIMSAIRSTGNRATEVRAVAIFRECGITGWRRRQPLFGRPDFTFPKAKLAVFVDGCFWHGCRMHAQKPSSNRSYWKQKFAQNRRRDRLVGRILRQQGWLVLRIWQHELGQPRSIARRILTTLDRRMKT
jgi:DNA mismatch endonuclease (patch repair protein)